MIDLQVGQSVWVVYAVEDTWYGQSYTRCYSTISCQVMSFDAETVVVWPEGGTAPLFCARDKVCFDLMTAANLANHINKSRGDSCTNASSKK